MIARIRVTALYVTHDQAEAFALAHRIAVMNQGRIVQEGDPRTVYAEPATPFAATFLGAANVVPGRIERRDSVGGAVITIANGEQRLTLQVAGEPGDAVDVIIRPEDLTVFPVKIDGANVLTSKILRVVFLGSSVEYHLDIGHARPLRATGRADPALAVGVPVWVGFDPRYATVLCGKADK
jgi:ABC-type Fe3+/spermidine/putrescine transport system ATPase subunit